jgi:Helix-turn-helix domain
MPKFLSPKQTADLLGKSLQTLASWRCNKRYPLAYIKVGGSVRYDERDVIAFLAQRRFAPREAR